MGAHREQGEQEQWSGARHGEEAGEYMDRGDDDMIPSGSL